MKQYIGHGVSIRVHYDHGALAGVAYWHPTVGGQGTCEGFVPVTPAPLVAAARPLSPPGWQLVREEPLTLSPSLRCRACGHHGFIRNGQWEPA